MYPNSLKLLFLNCVDAISINIHIHGICGFALSESFVLSVLQFALGQIICCFKSELVN